MRQPHLRYYGKEFAVWNDAKMSQTELHRLRQRRAAEEKAVWALAKGARRFTL